MMLSLAEPPLAVFSRGAESGMMAGEGAVSGGGDGGEDDGIVHTGQWSSRTKQTMEKRRKRMN